jgi:hypothetical protein
VLLAALGLAAGIAAVALLWRTGGNNDESFQPLAPQDPGPVHVHGLGVNPADGALFIATHTGLYRAGQGERRAKRVGGCYQDTMGFTIVGPNRFLGSGHPDINEAQEQGLPGLLGLIESTDSGENWEPISLLGEADFHVLRSVGGRVYGYDVTNDRLLVSGDRGRSWNKLNKPGPLVDLAVDPSNAERMVAASTGGLEEGLFESTDNGRHWKRRADTVGLLAWPRSDRLYLVVQGGLVFVSDDGGRQLRNVGDIGGAPAALFAQGPGELYVARHDGTVKRSTDGRPLGGSNDAVTANSLAAGAATPHRPSSRRLGLRVSAQCSSAPSGFGHPCKSTCFLGRGGTERGTGRARLASDVPTCSISSCRSDRDARASRSLELRAAAPSSDWRSE